jgi:pyridoxine 5-phosphate synthase
MTKLSVNINKVATLRNARGGNTPDVLSVARDCELFGAQGITVHPRPDERHIRSADVYALRPLLGTEFNIEGYPSEDFRRLVEDVRPAQVTLVPDKPGQLTSNHGWDTEANLGFLTEVLAAFKARGIRTSVFIDASERMADFAKLAGADRVELYTGPYAAAYAAGREEAIEPFERAARHCHEIGLGLNAGHDLSLANLAFFHKRIPWLDEVSIGHALISDALYMGLRDTIAAYLHCLA